MKKQITVYFSPVTFDIELADGLDEREIEEEINRQVYDVEIDNITNNAIIDYWEA